MFAMNLLFSSNWNFLHLYGNYIFSGHHESCFPLVIDVCVHHQFPITFILLFIYPFCSRGCQSPNVFFRGYDLHFWFIAFDDLLRVSTMGTPSHHSRSPCVWFSNKTNFCCSVEHSVRGRWGLSCSLLGMFYDFRLQWSVLAYSLKILIFCWNFPKNYINCGRRASLSNFFVVQCQLSLWSLRWSVRLSIPLYVQTCLARIKKSGF